MSNQTLKISFGGWTFYTFLSTKLLFFHFIFHPRRKKILSTASEEHDPRSDHIPLWRWASKSIFHLHTFPIDYRYPHNHLIEIDKKVIYFRKSIICDGLLNWIWRGWIGQCEWLTNLSTNPWIPDSESIVRIPLPVIL